VIALDAQGADAGAATVADGARRSGLPVTLFGPAAELSGHGAAGIVDAPVAIGGDEEPVRAVRTKPEASIVQAAVAVAEGSAEALVSAGPTGAALAASVLHVKRIKGVHRPAIAVLLPLPGSLTLLLDAGANTEVRPDHLEQFAYLGAAFMEAVHGVDRPRVGLLSVGEEESKGNELTREAHQLLKSAPVRFVGNVEGPDVFAGEADVIVCDGFTGNVTLKISEGLVETVEQLLHDELSSTFGTRVGYILSRQAFRRFRKRVDYSEYGGAPLVGVNGLCVVGHGRSSAKAVRNALVMAARFVADGLVPRLAHEVAQLAAGTRPSH
jgi:phosphate acyltransferase